MIDIVNLSLQFNGKYLFKNINYRINGSDRISLVGANGTGKSSLLKIICGQLQPESGTINKSKRTTIGYLPQENVSLVKHTVIEEAKSALTDITFLQEKEKEITQQLLNKNLSQEEILDLTDQLGEVHHRLEDLDSFRAEAEVEKILMGLGFDKTDFTRKISEFSGGWQMRIALAKILITQNDILLLDEPTNHLDIISLQWLIGYLKSYKGALLIVSHDRFFIDKVTNKTLELFNGKFYTYNGKYDAYLKAKEEREIQAEHLYELQQKKIKETERFIERFRYKASKAKQVQSRIKQLEKIETIDLPEQTNSISIKFNTAPPSGRILLTLNNISKSYGNKIVIKDLNFQIEREDKIAFVGPNGAGKTTLANILAGELKYDSGERIPGHNLLVSYYTQDVADNLNPELDILESIDNIDSDKTIGQLRGILGAFLFRGDDVFKKVGVLSGGEKSRVALCKILLTKSNLIILDEPTNHLDYESKKILQRALINFNGALILVSHDIDFLRPIVNKVVEVKKQSIKIFPDGIDYYLEKTSTLFEDKVEIEKRDTEFFLSRKEQKRIEAELRQKKYQKTKELNLAIKKAEDEITKLEEEIKSLELQLENQSLYTDGNKVKMVTQLYSETKRNLEEAISEWEKLSETLQKIEQEFE